MHRRASTREELRLATLERYDILDTQPEQAFDDIATLAAVVCGVPYAQINFIDAERQWTKATVGLPPEARSRELSLCAICVERREPLIVDDMWADSSLRNLLRGTLVERVRFYAGVPLMAPDGQAVGTLCVLAE